MTFGHTNAIAVFKGLVNYVQQGMLNVEVDALDSKMGVGPLSTVGWGPECLSVCPLLPEIVSSWEELRYWEHWRSGEEVHWREWSGRITKTWSTTILRNYWTLIKPGGQLFNHLDFSFSYRPGPTSCHHFFRQRILHPSLRASSPLQVSLGH